MLYTLKDVV